jgi:hypothetical protein
MEAAIKKNLSGKNARENLRLFQKGFEMGAIQ